MGVSKQPMARIRSGGQTGADRAALDFAIQNGIPHCGWIPKGRLAEDGRLPHRYGLTEMASENYSARTEQNVVDADGTLILSFGPLSGGSLLTQKYALQHKKPVLHIDFDRGLWTSHVAHAVTWFRMYAIVEVNVAGPRASGEPRIYEAVLSLLRALWHNLKSA